MPLYMRHISSKIVSILPYFTPELLYAFQFITLAKNLNLLKPRSFVLIHELCYFSLALFYYKCFQKIIFILPAFVFDRHDGFSNEPIKSVIQQRVRVARKAGDAIVRLCVRDSKISCYYCTGNFCNSFLCMISAHWADKFKYLIVHDFRRGCN